MTASAKITDDPFPYTGPIRSFDGKAPIRHHMFGRGQEQWVARYELDGLKWVEFDARIEIWHVILRPGQEPVWSTTMATYEMEAGKDCYGKRCIFPTRTAAIRASAARVIRLVRVAHRKKWGWIMAGEAAPRVIAWALEVVARETGQAQPTVRFIPTPPRTPQPVRKPTGLPLLDLMEAT